MSKSGNGTKLGAAALGVAVLLAPGAILAGGPINADQDVSTVIDGAAAPGLVLAQSLQVVSQFLGIADTPGAAAALTSLEAALATAEAGSPEVAAALADVIPAIVTPEVAADPPPLTASQAQTALSLVNQMISSLSAQGVAVPPTLSTLGATLASRLG